MPDTEETQPEDFSAELFILEDMGVEAEKLTRINSKAAAEKLIEYYKAKGTDKPEEEKKPKLNLKPNMGFQGLPPPDNLNDVLKLNLADKLSPCSVRRAANNRYHKNSRLCVIFTDDHPEGMVF